MLEITCRGLYAFGHDLKIRLCLNRDVSPSELTIRPSNPNVMKPILRSTQLSMQFLPLIYVKMPTTVAILTFIRRIHSPSDRIKQGFISFRNLVVWANEMSCSAVLSMKKFYNLMIKTFALEMNGYLLHNLVESIRQVITMASNLDPDQDLQNVGPDLDPNRLTLWFFLQKVNFCYPFWKPCRSRPAGFCNPLRRFHIKEWQVLINKWINKLIN